MFGTINNNGGGNTQRIYDPNSLNAAGWTIDTSHLTGNQKRMMFANLRKAKSMAPDPNEESKEPEGGEAQLADAAANQLNLQLMYGFLNEF